MSFNKNIPRNKSSELMTLNPLDVNKSSKNSLSKEYFSVFCFDDKFENGLTLRRNILTIFIGFWIHNSTLWIVAHMPPNNKKSKANFLAFWLQKIVNLCFYNPLSLHSSMLLNSHTYKMLLNETVIAWYFSR